MRDMLDGFFPGPLRKEFPDGIPIKVGRNLCAVVNSMMYNVNYELVLIHNVGTMGHCGKNFLTAFPSR